VTASAAAHVNPLTGCSGVVSCRRHLTQGRRKAVIAMSLVNRKADLASIRRRAAYPQSNLFFLETLLRFPSDQEVTRIRLTVTTI
jgi:hypothetical protein